MGPGVSAARDAAGSELDPRVAAALAEAARRVAAPVASAADTAAVAAAAVHAEHTGAVRPPLTATATTAATTRSVAPREFVAAAAWAVAAGQADAADLSSRRSAQVVGSVAASTARTPTSADARAAAATAAAASAAGAVGRTAALATVAAVRRAAGQAAGSGTGGPTAQGAGGEEAPNGDRSRRTRPATEGALEATLHTSVDVQMERGQPRAAVPMRPYVLPVPLQLLQSPHTTRETLQELCRERGISFGEDDSGASMKASLVRCNAYNRTTWGARMHWMANYVRGEAQEGRGSMQSFHMAMRHPRGVGVDQSPVGTQPPFTAAAPPPRTTTTSIPARPPSPSPARPPLYTSSPLPPRGGFPTRRTPSPSPCPTPPTLPLATLPSPDVPRVGCAPAPFTTPRTLPPPVASVSGDMLPSSHHAALFMESLSAEQAALVNTCTAQYTDLRGLVVNIATAVAAGAESAATATTRLDGAMTKVVQSNADVTAAAASIKAAVPYLQGSLYRPSKRAKAMGGVHARGRADGRGAVAGGEGAAARNCDAPGAAAAAEATAATSAAATAAVAATAMRPSASLSSRYYNAVVHEMTIPPEMVTAALDTEPLFNQLSTMLKMCHVTAGHPGLFGSLAVNGLYQDRVKYSIAVRKKGGASADINQAKTVRMTNIIKNKVHLYLRQLYWMHSVVPNLLKLPPKASYDDMKGAKVGEH